jgi:hypothetical protein
MRFVLATAALDGAFVVVTDDVQAVIATTTRKWRLGIML